MVNHVMIPRNSQLQSEVSRTFATSEPDQRRVNIRIVEGDRLIRRLSVLGNFRIIGLPESLPRAP